MTNKAVSEWLTQAFLVWQKDRGERQTIGEFSAWLGVQRTTLTKWMNGDRNPDKESIDLLASKLGPEIYDVLGLDRPDPLLAIVKRRWHLLPDGIRKQIAGMVERYAKDGDGDAESKSVDKKLVGVKR